MVVEVGGVAEVAGVAEMRRDLSHPQRAGCDQYRCRHLNKRL